jgi:hypothetical protein
LYSLILCETGFTDFLFCEGVFLECLGERVFGGAGGVDLLQELGGCEGVAGDGVVEGLWLGFRRGRSGECGLGFGGVGCFGEESDFVGDAAADVAKGFTDVGRVVVGFVVVLFALSISIGS